MADEDDDEEEDGVGGSGTFNLLFVFPWFDVDGSDVVEVDVDTYFCCDFDFGRLLFAWEVDV